MQAKTVFILLRLSRLYPLHFLTLMMVVFFTINLFKQNEFFLVYQNNDFVSFFFFKFFFISDWGFENGYSFNGPIWSISVEIMVYIFLFYKHSNIFGRSILIKFF